MCVYVCMYVCVCMLYLIFIYMVIYYFIQVTAIVSEGPKLTHLTTSRPKMKNRRPPRKYAVFHEDDSREDIPVIIK